MDGVWMRRRGVRGVVHSSDASPWSVVGPQTLAPLERRDVARRVFTDPADFACTKPGAGGRAGMQGEGGREKDEGRGSGGVGRGRCIYRVFWGSVRLQIRET